MWSTFYIHYVLYVCSKFCTTDTHIHTQTQCKAKECTINYTNTIRNAYSETAITHTHYIQQQYVTNVHNEYANKINDLVSSIHYVCNFCTIQAYHNILEQFFSHLNGE